VSIEKAMMVFGAHEQRLAHDAAHAGVAGRPIRPPLIFVLTFMANLLQQCGEVRAVGARHQPPSCGRPIFCDGPALMLLLTFIRREFGFFEALLFVLFFMVGVSPRIHPPNNAFSCVSTRKSMITGGFVSMRRSRSALLADA
jgi:hypothetical protein